MNKFIEEQQGSTLNRREPGSINNPTQCGSNTTTSTSHFSTGEPTKKTLKLAATMHNQCHHRWQLKVDLSKNRTSINTLYLYNIFVLFLLWFQFCIILFWNDFLQVVTDFWFLQISLWRIITPIIFVFFKQNPNPIERNSSALSVRKFFTHLPSHATKHGLSGRRPPARNRGP